MKKFLLSAFTGFLIANSFNAFAQTTTSLKIYDKAIYYDMYAAKSTEPVPVGAIRLKNELYTTKLSSEQLNSIGDKMTFKVTVNPLCDNYDRICNVNLAFVPKGADGYTLASTDIFRIEVGRFITPFMNKNKTPDAVPYELVADNIAKIFKDPLINMQYDIWAELQITGVPYAANKEIAGCAGRNDVFMGTLELISNTNNLLSSNNFLLPLNFQKNLNNYKDGASDEIGTTERTITFDLAQPVNSATLNLITSNHGAGTNGEEYNRRMHYIYFDGALKTSYKPGEKSCEPYRIYNTQGNGIYGPSARTDAQWQSFSNWCPGAKIPTRIIPLGTLSAGTHTFKITVPDAVFYNKDGNFPVSLYLQGTTSNYLGIDNTSVISCSLYPNPSKDFINISADQEIQKVIVYNMLGQQIWEGKSDRIDISQFESGIYTCEIEFINNRKVSQKIIKN